MRVVRIVPLTLAMTLTVGAPAAAASRGAGGERAEGGSERITWEYDAGDQGRSGSDPDGTTNGGADKPGHSGGFDDDRDGNNGCGNDVDFEDDNNGRCGGRRGDAPGGGDANGNGGGGDGQPDTALQPAVETPAEGAGTSAPAPSPAPAAPARPAGTAGSAGAGGSAAEEAVVPTGVLGVHVERAAGGAARTTSPGEATGGVTPATSPGGTQVQGVAQERPGPGVLARTGAGAAGLALVGGALAVAGRLARRLARHT